MTGYGTEESRVPPHEIPTVPARPLTDLYRFTKSTMTAIFDVFALNGQIVYAIAADCLEPSSCSPISVKGQSRCARMTSALFSILLHRPLFCGRVGL
jgi:hypothetical protein